MNAGGESRSAPRESDPAYKAGRSIGAELAYQARAHADAPALAFPETGHRLTFAQWHEQASRVAAGLIRLGVLPGDRVALLAQNRVGWPVAYAGILLAGAVTVPLNTHYRRDDLHHGLAHCAAKVLITSSRFRGNEYLAQVQALGASLPSLQHLITFDEDSADALGWSQLMDQPPPHSLPAPKADSVGSLQYTSGTTGFPKGALLTHAGMLRNAAEAASRLHLTHDDRWTSIIPLFHCAGCILNLLGCLQRGACYVGVSHFDPVLMFETIDRERCTVLSGVPTSYLAMLEHPQRSRFNLSSLRTGTCGGADADPGVLQRCAVEFPIENLVQVYGQTESSTLIACPDCEDPARFETVGPALDGYQVRITDPGSGAALQPGRIGQIEARGPMVMLGYHQDEAATRETLSDSGWLRTGDLGYLREDERLVIAGGRLRDMIIRGGENVYPVEVENRIRDHHAVGEVAVFAISDDYYGESVAAALRLDAEVDSASLHAWCAQSMARFKIPQHWFRVEDYPMTASGKIRKVMLRAQASAGELEVLA